ncbi:hypothetical protein F442_09121 [Phytophthora nicotianae P10297]|uniref:Uncharacterized protein n=6 Tax=Phytophthora nicotianae TaxID=4792 RepID=W2Q735_PHYN3|nr:hypothetical protein PPTG_12156 [Phytophthora nicotianae INRA-310]ETI46428.1 hypothetical protein F443_09198 [Phytophthora nicotianae P1569]ETK86342.1 hypothetical protein L915_09021 [Phytophthora nicotianae]ETO75102.1 hypothetical protein F444_09276 [Phytophthora nicotianae P1976]ETP44274.1 hypothetical protein F442_09121 [Phytophthora nicotianae P10297]ETL39768.1 hypothetical protein L916_08937 [Phytophthora nicotianae]
MFRLIFKSRQSSDETRPKSWSGKPESVPTAATEPFVRHASANVIVPSRYSSSEQPASRTRSIREETGDDDDDCDSSWRKRQTHCVNCECLFFTALSSLSCDTGRFCSLDCKTSFEYVNHLEEVLAAHMRGGSDATSDSLGSSSDEDDYEVEEFDLDQL